MAIICDGEPSNTPDIDIDPFELKAMHADDRHRKILEIFLSLSGNASCELKDTTIMQLFLSNAIVFLDLDTMAILRLDEKDIHHRRVYQDILFSVQHTAMVLKTKVHANLLQDMPLTDIRRICYRIADRYDSLFYIPDDLVKEAEDANVAVCFEWNDRYNCMWPIVCLLYREYSKLE